MNGRPVRNAKIGVRTSHPSPVRHMGRVAQKGSPGIVRQAAGRAIFKGKLNYAPW